MPARCSSCLVPGLGRGSRADAHGPVRRSLAAWGCRLGTQRFRRVGRPVFTPDGKAIVVGQGSVVRVLDPGTGAELRRIGWAIDPFVVFAFVPDGKSAVSLGTDQVFHLWDLDGMKETRRWPAPTGQGNVLSFSQDGHTLLSWLDFKNVNLWDVATGGELKRLPVSGHLVALHLSADGKTLSSAEFNGTIRAVEVATGKELHQHDLEYGRNGTYCFAPDGQTITGSAGRNRQLRVWNVADGKLERSFPVELPNFVRRQAFSADGRTLATAHDNESFFRVWDVATGQELGQLKGRDKNRVLALSFTPDGKTLLAANSSAAVSRWDIARGQPLGPCRDSCIRFSPWPCPATARPWCWAGSTAPCVCGTTKPARNAGNHLAPANRNIPWL